MIIGDLHTAKSGAIQNEFIIINYNNYITETSLAKIVSAVFSMNGSFFVQLIKEQKC